MESSVPSIIFPHLGIEIGYFPSSFSIGKFSIAYYGVIIAIAMIVAVLVIYRLAKKTNQSGDNYIDMAIVVIICGIIGARIYYVLFSLDYYKANPGQIFNIRGGGLAIYGGLIAAFIAGYVVCRIKKISYLRVLDTALPGVVLGQCIGRWANFVNREAFGEYTDSLFAMQLRLTEVNTDNVTDLMIQNMVTKDGVQYVQVSPTFLYESLWCLVVFVLIMIFRKYQKYNGEVALWYLGGYALGRAWIEGLRTDALYIGHSNIPVSQLLSIALVAGSFAILLINRVRLARKTWEPEFSLILPDGAPGTTAFAEKLKAERKAAKAEKYEESHGEEKKDASKWETYTVKKDGEDTSDEADEQAETNSEVSEETSLDEEPVEDAETEEVTETDETSE
ncbi:MAG: prolipoprotein diacylglyceryl transferase [Lachnospiraceae bacterium]|nr:prolipoprotein diacylglyceryl transferase [Lachnospiraceae bacterium]